MNTIVNLLVYCTVHIQSSSSSYPKQIRRKGSAGGVGSSHGMNKTAVIEPKEIQVGQRGIRIIQILESGVWLAWDEKKYRAHV